MSSEYIIPQKVVCGNCLNRDKGFSGPVKGVSIYDKCRISRPSYDKDRKTSSYITCLLKFPKHYDVNPLNCDKKYVREVVKNSRLWVSLYFRGREKNWIIVEINRYEVLIEANWFVKRVFGIADKFHRWQDKCVVKRFEQGEAKRKSLVLTAIVKELPRL